MAALSNDIYVGSLTDPIFHYTNADIDASSMSGVFAVDVIGNELSIDQISPIIKHAPAAGHILITNDGHALLTTDGHLLLTAWTAPRPNELPYATPVWWYNDGELQAKMYLATADPLSRLAKEDISFWRLNCVSAVGLLEEQYHVGGVYRGETFAEVAAEIINGAFPFSCSEAVAAIRVYNWLPYTKSRANLHQLLFAHGVNLFKDAQGDVVFDFLTAEDPVVIPDDRIVFGGTTRAEKAVTQVDVTEYSYIRLGEERDELVTLYDNTDGSGTAVNQLVTFRQAPVYNLQASESLEIVETGVNYAILNGTGVLTGRRYTVLTNIFSLSGDSAGVAVIKRVENMTLVNIANSENVAKRVLAYLSASRTIQAEIELNGERCGQSLTVKDSFYDTVSAFLASMELSASSNLLAAAQLVEGYTPTGQGNNYNTADLLTGEGEIEVPEGGATLALIGGGDGGTPGEDGSGGTSGSAGTEWRGHGEGGEGGAPGTPGTGGKVLTIRLPAGKYRYKCGSGGESGAEGTATELYDEAGNLIYSSADGQTPPNGYLNLFTGDLLAQSGGEGIAGAKGGKPDGYAAGDVTFGGQTWTGGAQGAHSDTGTGVGGGGGGAAAGANGNDGDAGTAARGGNGGAGADATARAAASGYGNGGDAGHGGGGGGGGGTGQSTSGWYNAGSGGAGGKGGLGGKGGDGAIIMYSKKEAA